MRRSDSGELIPRKLIFIRHSKAEEQLPGMSDFERSLTATGKHHSRLMAQILKAKKEDPGKVITSPAFRAIETALIFCREYDISPDTIQISSELYSGLEQEDFIPFIGKQDDNVQTLTLFGHNPLITEMAAFFASDEPDVLPKTGIFCVSFEAASWSDIGPESGLTQYFLTPKSHL